MTTNAVLEIGRAAHGETRLVEAELGPLADGQVRLRVDRYALTANNVTYAVIGEMLGYWDFFPTGDPAWGRVPAMGWADVVESTHPEVPVGGRYYGWFPRSGRGLRGAMAGTPGRYQAPTGVGASSRVVPRSPLVPGRQGLASLGLRQTLDCPSLRCVSSRN